MKVYVKHIWFLILLFPFAGLSQVDSLLKEAEMATSDTAKLRNLVLVTEYCDIPDIEKYANTCIQLSDDLLEQGGVNEEDVLFYKSTAINNMGFMYHVYSDYEEAINQYEESIAIYEKIGDTLGISRGYNNLAMVYKDAGDMEKAVELLSKAHAVSNSTGDYQLLNITLTNFSNIYSQTGELEKAIEYLYEAIKLQEEHEDARGLAHTYTTLASLYYSQEDYENSKVYCEMAVKKGLEVNDLDVLGSAYNNLGFIYDYLEQDSLALEYYNLSLKYREQVNDIKGISESYSNLGSYYIENGDTLKGIDYIEEAVVLREKIGNAEGLCNSYQKLAAYYLEKGETKKALKLGEKSFELAEQIGYSEDIKNSALVLSKVYFKINNYKKAYEMHVLYLEKRDLIFNKENQKKIIQQQIDYEYTKKHLADSLENAKAMEMAALEAEMKNKETQLEKKLVQDKLNKVNQRNAAMLVGIIFLLATVILAFFAYQSKKRSEQTISRQKEQVEEQKQMLEESNKEILDSITYAHRIQNAILPPAAHMKKHLPDSFVIYRPKDIVAGDFYWMEELDDRVVFAAADCTGHGVPGALVSVICSTALSKAVMEEHITDPGKLLDRTRELVIQTFARSNEDVKDGMDISLCRLKGRSLWWAGANNPLWIIKNGTTEITEIKANKQPVGLYADPVPFETHHISLERGDTVYIFSDGYQDQFGGDKGKKLKTGNFKKLLLEHNHLEISEIKDKLENFFENWRGEFEQVDDVCVIAFRV